MCLTQTPFIIHRSRFKINTLSFFLYNILHPTRQHQLPFFFQFKKIQHHFRGYPIYFITLKPIFRYQHTCRIIKQFKINRYIVTTLTNNRQIYTIQTSTCCFLRYPYTFYVFGTVYTKTCIQSNLFKIW